MNIVKTNIEGVLIIKPRLFRDSRGYFFESFSGTHCSLLLGQRVNEQLWRHARSALPLSA